VLQLDPKSLDIDAPLPPDIALPQDGGHTFFRATLALARRSGGTVRDLIWALNGGTGHRTIVGTPGNVADDIERWFLSGAADGFNLMPDVLPHGLEVFVDEVVPILRKRGLFRNHYEGRTLRDHLGLARPDNPYATAAE
jgi:alkanesulfonate monooxygenase SsuD/methylene tetrahydromethanopterin reductase-like flavin-dependent oxidoreductase (luciferase family)